MSSLAVSAPGPTVGSTVCITVIRPPLELYNIVAKYNSQNKLICSSGH